PGASTACRGSRASASQREPSSVTTGARASTKPQLAASARGAGTDCDVGRRLVPVAAAFACFGLFWGTWAVAAIDVERFLRFSDGGLGALLACAVVAGAVINAVGGTLAERWGTRRSLSVFLAGWGGLLLALALVHPRWAFAAL